MPRRAQLGIICFSGFLKCWKIEPVTTLTYYYRDKISVFIVSIDFETVPVLAYEEVIKLKPLSHFPRPVVLVGR